jgi:hypothetical protein
MVALMFFWMTNFRADKQSFLQVSSQKGNDKNDEMSR